MTSEFKVEFVTNSHGFRDMEYEMPKAPGACRALVVGDSFSVGFGVKQENVYSQILEQSLNSDSAKTGSRQWEIINASVPAYDPYMYVEAARKYVPEFSVDMVIVGFYIGNDFISTGEDDRMIIENGYLVSWDRSLPNAAPGAGRGQSVGNYFRSFRVFLAFNSHLYVLLRNVANRYRWNFTIRNQKYKLGLYRTESASDRFGAVETHIEKLKGIVDFHDTSLLFIIIPQRKQVYDDIWSAAVTGSGLAPEEFAYDAPNRRLIRILERHDIRYIDLLPVMHNRQNEEFYFPRDGHWNSAGHSAAAGVIFKHIQNSGGSNLRDCK
ncbi:MAG: hypothetical protein HKN34_00775 [Gammaproteobacteria bacterium]|nr:hypothetical protein [Gammaproteobacteria bacterium]